MKVSATILLLVLSLQRTYVTCLNIETSQLKLVKDLQTGVEVEMDCIT